MGIRAFRIALCALVLFLPHALAQEKPKPHVEVAAIAARPEDVGSIEATVKTDYECISGGIGVARQWARDFSLYDPFARSFVPSKDAASTSISFTTPGTDGGFPPYPGTPRTISIRFPLN